MRVPRVTRFVGALLLCVVAADVAMVTTGVAAAAGAASGSEVVGAQSGQGVDPMMVGLVAAAVFLAGVVLFLGIQLWKSRGEEDDPRVLEPQSRKERRRARQTEKAVAAAERKTAREIEKAEKRAAKLAPPEAAAAKAGEVAARKQAKIDAKDARAAARQAEVDAKAAAKQAQLDDKERARHEQAAAKEAAKRAEAEAKAAGKQAKAGAKAERAAKRNGGEVAHVDTSAPTAPDPDVVSEAVDLDPGSTLDDMALLDLEPPAAGQDLAQPRVPLFSAPPPMEAPPTAGPFLESLFAAEEGAGDDSVPSPVPPASPPAVAPRELPEPVAAGLSLEPLGDEAPPLPDLTEQVSRAVPPPRGLRGRRRARRRQRAADHRHQQLRAINALLDIGLTPALPPGPVRKELGVTTSAAATPPPARAASVATAQELPRRPSLLAGPPEGSTGERANGVAVPWPGEGDAGDGGGPGQAWPSDTSH